MLSKVVASLNSTYPSPSVSADIAVREKLISKSVLVLRMNHYSGDDTGSISAVAEVFLSPLDTSFTSSTVIPAITSAVRTRIINSLLFKHRYDPLGSAPMNSPKFLHLVANLAHKHVSDLVL